MDQVEGRERRVSNPPRDTDHWMRRKPELIRRGTQANSAKITPEDRVTIAEMDDLGYLPKAIADHLKVNRVTIWRHLKALGRR